MSVKKLKSGSLRERKDGRWEVRYYINGKCYSAYGKSDAQAIDKYYKQVKEQVRHNVCTNNLLKDWLQQWYNLYKKQRLKDSSLNSINNTIKNHILPSLGQKKLKNLTGIQIQEFLNSLPRSRTRDVVAGVLKDALNKAYLNNLIRTNPFIAVELDKDVYKKRDALTLQQQEQFLKKIKGHHLEELFKFYLLTGTRRSEALALKWSDVNFENRTITVTTAKQRKGEVEQRLLPLTEEIEAVLLQLKESKKYDSEYLWPVQGNFPTRRFKSLVESLGWKNNITLHSLRHTFATRCLESGVPMKVVQYWLGHKSIVMTGNIYSHVQKEYAEKEMSKVVFLTHNLTHKTD